MATSSDYYDFMGPQAGATATPFRTYTAKQDTNKYNVSGYEYPSDLMGNSAKYGGNYMMFFINVAEDSKMIKNAEVATLSASDQAIVDSERIKKAITGLDITGSKIMAGAAAVGAVGGSIAGALASGNVMSIFSNLMSKEALIGAAGTGAIAGNVTAQASNFTRAQKRLQTAIALHIPNDLSIKYGVGWGEEETLMFQAAVQGMNEIASVGDKGLKTTMGGVSSLVAAVSMKGGAPMTQGAGIAAGMAPNPKKEQAFQGVDFRSFSFNYKFAPRNSIESLYVQNIINTFKYHMHPEFKDDAGFLYSYPSEFDIVYYKGATENLNIHRHTSCVLTGLSVNYTPNGIFNTFEDGSPTQIDIMLEFRELTTLTKELIKEGL